ncbi:DUF7837 family putative zinc-binding protein [Haloferax volcanii]
MTSDSTALGRCPDCGEEIEAYQSIIEFEDGGWVNWRFR